MKLILTGKPTYIKRMAKHLKKRASLNKKEDEDKMRKRLDKEYALIQQDKDYKRIKKKLSKGLKIPRIP